MFEMLNQSAATSPSDPDDGEVPQRCEIHIDSLDNDDASSAIADTLRHYLPQVLSHFDYASVVLDVTLVRDATMAQLHGDYMDQYETTDVMTFDLREAASEMKNILEGQLVICVDEATRQAQQRGHGVEHEALLYAVHGLLHLSGYDDRDAQACRQMHEREDQLLSAIGVGPIYGTSEALQQEDGT